jgi:ABC-type multidrug transport system fused ATPase/permease subunit
LGGTVGGTLAWLAPRGRTHRRVAVAFLPQRAHLAHESTVEDALRMLAPDATAAAMHEAIARVGLADRLGERGLLTLVGTLSVGQRQRLAIARALLVDAPLVVLDEPDANLDREGRARIDAIVRELAVDRFVAVVAHGDLARPAGAVAVALGSPASKGDRGAQASPTNGRDVGDGVTGA